MLEESKITTHLGDETISVIKQEDVYQRLYVACSSKRITPAYMIKLVVFPDPHKMLQFKESLSSLNPKQILNQPIICNKCSKVGTSQSENFIYCQTE